MFSQCRNHSESTSCAWEKFSNSKNLHFFPNTERAQVSYKYEFSVCVCVCVCVCVWEREREREYTCMRVSVSSATPLTPDPSSWGDSPVWHIRWLFVYQNRMRVNKKRVLNALFKPLQKKNLERETSSWKKTLIRLKLLNIKKTNEKNFFWMDRKKVPSMEICAKQTLLKSVFTINCCCVSWKKNPDKPPKLNLTRAWN
jgi:hypothetical protein